MSWKNKTYTHEDKVEIGKYVDTFGKRLTLSHPHEVRDFIRGLEISHKSGLLPKDPLEYLLSSLETEAQSVLKNKGYSVEKKALLVLYCKVHPLNPSPPENIDLPTASALYALLSIDNMRDYRKRELPPYYIAMEMFQLTMAAVSANIHDIAIEGILHHTGGKQGGKKSGNVRREKTKPTKDIWQAEAEKIWGKHPAWGNKPVAERIVKLIGGNVGTIRKSIKRPTPQA